MRKQEYELPLLYDVLNFTGHMFVVITVSVIPITDITFLLPVKARGDIVKISVPKRNANTLQNIVDMFRDTFLKILVSATTCTVRT